MGRIKVIIKLAAGESEKKIAVGCTVGAHAVRNLPRVFGTVPPGTAAGSGYNQREWDGSKPAIIPVILQVLEIMHMPGQGQ